MKSRHQATSDYFKTIGWVLLLLYLFLVLFALASGRIAGFEYASWISVAAGIMVTVVFATIIAINLLILALAKIVHYRGRGEGRLRQAGCGPKPAALRPFAGRPGLGRAVGPSGRIFR